MDPHREALVRPPRNSLRRMVRCSHHAVQQGARGPAGGPVRQLRPLHRRGHPGVFALRRPVLFREPHELKAVR
eukprot:4118723-Lingulodinium_polyedra.AAC.1